MVVVDVSTFGAGADRPGMSDLIALAASGLLSVNAAQRLEEAPPLRYRGELASIHAACAGALGALGALHARLADGRGQRIDVSAQAAIAAVLATALATYAYTGVEPVHYGNRGVGPWGFFTCRDGDVLIQVTEDMQWPRLAVILGHPEWAEMEVFATTAQRAELADALDPLVADAIADMTVDGFLAAASEIGVAAARIQDAADLLAWDHLVARRFFQPITVTNGEQSLEVIAPVPPWRLHRTAPAPARRSPRLGRAPRRGRGGVDGAPPRRSRPPVRRRRCVPSRACG